MNEKAKTWIITPLILVLVPVIFIWVIGDAGTGYNFLTADTPSQIRRLKAVAIQIVCFYLFYILAYYLARHFITLRERKYFPVFYEYLIIWLSASILMGVIAAIVFIKVNGEQAGMVNILLVAFIASPVLVLIYAFIRSNILTESLTKRSLDFEKIKGEKLKAELEYLKSQFHPHFLFNSLNTIYFQIDESNRAARNTVNLLSGLLRYQIYDINKPITLEKEVAFLQKYIEFQKIRMTDRLSLDVDFDIPDKEIPIQPLIFLPLVENAFKYVGGGYRIKVDLTFREHIMNFTIVNDLPENCPPADPDRPGGVGLENLRRRLEIIYPSRFALQTEKGENSFMAKLMIRLEV